jgi:hypothetical protein
MPRRNKVRAPARRFRAASQRTQCAETMGGVNVYRLNGLPLLVGVLALSRSHLWRRRGDLVRRCYAPAEENAEEPPQGHKYFIGRDKTVRKPAA